MFFDDAEQVDNKEALIADLAKLMDMETYMPDGHILLSRPVRDLHLRATELLLQAGVPVGYCRPGGHTALLDVLNRHRSESEEELLPMVDLLLKHGAPTEGNTWDGGSALSEAWRLGRVDIIGRLLDAGADPQAMNWDSLMVTVLNDSAEYVALELEYGADIAAGDVWGTTAWHMAFAVGDLEKIELLFAAGADINRPGAGRETPLMVAVTSRRREAVEWLLQQGASLDEQDDYGYSALMRAAEIDDIEMVRLLLKAGADATLNDGWRRNNCDWQGGEPPSPAVDLESDPHKFQYEFFSLQSAMSLAQSPEVARLLSAAGGKLAEINDVLYSRWVSPVQQMAWRLDDEDFDEYISDASTCYGHTLTELPDGRLIEIGGAISNEYNVRFEISNNVGVYYGGGRHKFFFQVERYFPPIDFHTATVVEDVIYIIGGLGYEHLREEGYTPVYKLNCDSYNVELVKTVGDNPGSLSRHHARYYPDAGSAGEIHVWGGSIALKNGAGWDTRYGDVWRLVANHTTFILDLKTRRWRRVEYGK